jgi:hypothetical protein
MSKVYLYKMTVDAGGAPCVYDGMLSLAICKPAIRRTASFGDFILGFAGNSLYENNCLVFVAQVGHPVSGIEYYSKKYERRPDCIYEYFDGSYRWRSGAMYHSPTNLTHDLGEPPDYESAKVLLVEKSSDFRYFRDFCPIDYRSKYGELAKFIREMRQGHRINLTESLQAAVQSLLSEVFATPETLCESDVLCTPSSSTCSQDEGEAKCRVP